MLYPFLLTCPCLRSGGFSDIPCVTFTGLHVQSLFWHCNGESLILLGKDQLCVCYMATDEEK